MFSARRLLWATILLAACGGETERPQPEAPPSEPPPPEEVVEPLMSIDGAVEFVDLNADPNILEVELVAGLAQAELSPGVMTDVMAYNGGTPGPLLHARAGDRVIVHFRNDLPEPTTVHWHGLRISDEMDGNPRIQNPVAPGGTFTYDFVLPEPGTYWYHPHVNTIEQVERGLYGAIVVEEPDAPLFTREQLVVLDDIRLDSDGQIAVFATAGHDIVHGRAGNLLLTNGSTEPLAGSLPAGSIERWRLVNTANARTMKVGLSGASWRVIATDGGLLPAAFSTDTLELAVGQRFDLEVRVDGSAPNVELLSYVLADAGGGAVEEVPITVASLSVEGSIEAEEPWYPLYELPAIPSDSLEQPILLGGFNEGGEVVFTVNGVPGDELEDLVFMQGQPVSLEITNEIGPYHPFHLHGQFFQVLTRDGAPANEPGLKDTVMVNAFETVRIVTTFDNPGMWMYHCHIGSHAENGMMAHLMVTPSE
jgi:FtsP/CotA-like multicopper oxidase with cupredoxin domain